MLDEPRIEEIAPDGRAFPYPADDGPSSRHAARARLGGSSPSLVRGTALVVALIALAVAKPWAPLAPASPAASASEASDREAAGSIIGPAAGVSLASAGAAALTGAAAASPPPAGRTLPPGAIACGAPDGWRLVTVGAFAGRPSDAISEVEPVAGAATPDDPRIQLLRAGEAPLVAVGLCRPTATPGVADDRTARPPVLVVGAWRLAGLGADPLPLVERGTAAATSAVAQLYAPTGAAGGGWGPGRYVLEVTVADLAAPAWLGFEVTQPPPSLSSSAPSAP